MLQNEELSLILSLPCIQVLRVELVVNKLYTIYNLQASISNDLTWSTTFALPKDYATWRIEWFMKAYDAVRNACRFTEMIHVRDVISSRKNAKATNDGLQQRARVNIVAEEAS